jgi:hypothetical protein
MVPVCRKKLTCLSQAGSKTKTRFDFESVSPDGDSHSGLVSSGADDEAGKRRPTYMPTRGFAAVLNQGLVTLGEKLGKEIQQERFSIVKIKSH